MNLAQVEQPTVGAQQVGNTHSPLPTHYLLHGMPCSTPLGYALVALMIALPLGWMLAQYICDLEKTRPRLARVLDVFTMLPFAVSSVMIGLGVMLGMIRIDAEFFYSLWLTPALAHVMITTPFVVRIILPALRSIDPMYDECARTLGISKFKTIFHNQSPNASRFNLNCDNIHFSDVNGRIWGIMGCY